MASLRTPVAPLSYTLEGAAEATGYGLSTIKRAIAAGDLTRRYANSKPVILSEDLLGWLRSLPIEPPGGGRHE